MLIKQPRFSEGSRVRIKIKDTSGQVLYSEFKRYENMTGVVLSSKAIVAYILQPVAITENSYINRVTTLHTYTVKLIEGVTLQNLYEYLLEEI